MVRGASLGAPGVQAERRSCPPRVLTLGLPRQPQPHPSSSFKPSSPRTRSEPQPQFPGREQRADGWGRSAVHGAGPEKPSVRDWLGRDLAQGRGHRTLLAAIGRKAGRRAGSQAGPRLRDLSELVRCAPCDCISAAGRTFLLRNWVSGRGGCGAAVGGVGGSSAAMAGMTAGATHPPLRTALTL